MGIPVNNSELVSMRDFGRSAAKYIGELERDKRDKVVITRHGRMKCVVLTIEDYEELLKK